MPGQAGRGAGQLVRAGPGLPRKLHGAAAALTPAGAGMGQVAGYTAADYLIQHASRERRYARVPASTWDAVLSYIRDPADTAMPLTAPRQAYMVRLRRGVPPVARSSFSHVWVVP